MSMEVAEVPKQAVENSPQGQGKLELIKSAKIPALTTRVEEKTRYFNTGEGRKNTFSFDLRLGEQGKQLAFVNEEGKVKIPEDINTLSEEEKKHAWVLQQNDKGNLEIKKGGELYGEFTKEDLKDGLVPLPWDNANGTNESLALTRFDPEKTLVEVFKYKTDKVTMLQKIEKLKRLIDFFPGTAIALSSLAGTTEVNVAPAVPEDTAAPPAIIAEGTPSYQTEESQKIVPIKQPRIQTAEDIIASLNQQKPPAETTTQPVAETYKCNTPEDFDTWVTKQIIKFRSPDKDLEALTPEEIEAGKKDFIASHSLRDAERGKEIYEKIKRGFFTMLKNESPQNIIDTDPQADYDPEKKYTLNSCEIKAKLNIVDEALRSEYTKEGK